MITEKTDNRFCKVKGQMMAKNGKQRKDEDVIIELMDFWEENKK